MSRRLRIRAAATAASIALTTFVQIAGVQNARADASGRASCIGIEASAISPPGSSDEFPGGLPEVLAVVRGEATPLSVTQGAVFSFVAHIHAGSHEDCDKATA